LPASDHNIQNKMVVGLPAFCIAVLNCFISNWNRHLWLWYGMRWAIEFAMYPGQKFSFCFL